MFGSIGPLEIGIVLLVVLLLFGAKRLPELGSGVGRGLRGFKEGITGENRDEDEDKALTSAEPSEPLSSVRAPESSSAPRN
jgi:sec-independent protein translocase protein TatA